MKVILNQTVPNVGKQYSVVTVADGYARNYLFPRNLAILADKKQINALERRNARVAEKTAGEKTSAESLREVLNGKSIRIEGQVGQGKLFGAITSQNIADAIKSQLGHEIDRKKIALVDPIKRLGSYRVEIDLHHSVDAVITVNVVDPNAVEVTPVVEKTEDEEEA